MSGPVLGDLSNIWWSGCSDSLKDSTHVCCSKRAPKKISQARWRLNMNITVSSASYDQVEIQHRKITRFFSSYDNQYISNQFPVGLNRSSFQVYGGMKVPQNHLSCIIEFTSNLKLLSVQSFKRGILVPHMWGGGRGANAIIWTYTYTSTHIRTCARFKLLVHRFGAGLLGAMRDVWGVINKCSKAMKWSLQRLC